MIQSATHLANGILLTFTDGAKGFVSWHALEVDPGMPKEVSVDPWRLVVRQGAASLDFPWDYLRSLADPKFLEIERARAQAVRLALKERLRARRAAAGLSQEELAARCGLPPETVQAWEEGRLAISCLGLARLNRAGLDL